MEHLPVEPNNSNESIEKRVDKLARQAMERIYSFYGLQISNFEYIKLRAIARGLIGSEDNLVDEVEKNSKDNPGYLKNNWKEISTVPFDTVEVEHRFFLTEYGIHPSEFPKDESNTAVTEDFKKYLKILQKRHQEGDDEQSQLTSRN